MWLNNQRPCANGATTDSSWAKLVVSERTAPRMQVLAIVGASEANDASVQIGWALQVRNEMAKAVDEAARFTLLPDRGPGDFENKLEELLAHYDEDRLVIPAHQKITVSGVAMNVFSAQYQLPVFVPFVAAELGSLSVTRRTPAS